MTESAAPMASTSCPRRVQVLAGVIFMAIIGDFVGEIAGTLTGLLFLVWFLTGERLVAATLMSGVVGAGLGMSACLMGGSLLRRFAPALALTATIIAADVLAPLDSFFWRAARGGAIGMCLGILGIGRFDRYPPLADTRLNKALVFGSIGLVVGTQLLGVDIRNTMLGY